MYNTLCNKITGKDKIMRTDGYPEEDIGWNDEVCAVRGCWNDEVCAVCGAVLDIENAMPGTLAWNGFCSIECQDEWYRELVGQK
jgi:hypothetical protein